MRDATTNGACARTPSALLQAQLESVRSNPGDAKEVFSARERQHMRSLQQRLEQLVAVHRQLLRKYAALELDNSEGKKKISLRDERIKQLELNSRALATNMRSQAERHVAELTKLREQVSLLREEQQQQQMEARLEAATSSARAPGGVRTVRGGGGDPAGPRTISGGGGAAAGASAEGGGFLRRLFDNKQ